MTRIIVIIFGVVVVALGALVAIASFIPSETYKEKIEALAQEQTGRTLTIDGDVGLTILPSLGVNAQKVRFANADWGSTPDMMSMEELNVSLKILPLLTGSVELDSFTLVRPQIHLEINRQGNANWEFTPQTQTEGEEVAASGETDSQAGSSVGNPIKDIRLGDIRISDGTASYKDAQAGASYEITEINLGVSLPSLDDPLNVDGSAVWNGDKMTIAMMVEKPRVLLEGGTTAITADASTPKVTKDFEGSLVMGDTPAFNGNLTLNVPSVRALAAWAGSPMAGTDGFGELDLKGTVAGNSTEFSFSDAVINFDGMAMEGFVSANVAGQVPYIKGALAVDKIDANVYMGGDADASGSGSGGSSSSAATTSSAGWSTDPIDMTGLRAINADLDLSAGAILIQKIKIGESKLKLKLRNGVMTANLAKLALYEGAGKGSLTLDGSRSTPKISADFDLSGLQAQPLLTDAADFTRLEGTTLFDFAINTSGKSQKAMVSALSGKGKFDFQNGAIRGINIAQLMRNVFSNPLSGWGAGGTQSTDFSELNGSFTIARGILTNSDLKMLSPLIRIAGKGTVDMPKQTLNYRVEPKLVGSLEGQGGSSASGIEVPVVISGPWSDPSFSPDLAAALSNNPDAIVDAVKNLGGKSGGASDLVDGLLGGGSSDKESGAGKALKGLFGR
ncbi:MAG: AsmA protein [Parvibaculaceae bacterium]|jgi:AsmA protein